MFFRRKVPECPIDQTHLDKKKVMFSLANFLISCMAVNMLLINGIRQQNNVHLSVAGHITINISSAYNIDRRGLRSSLVVVPKICIV